MPSLSMLTLITWLRSCLSFFSTVESLPLTLPYCWKEVIRHSPHLRSGELCFPPWGDSIYINCLEFFCIEICLFSPIDLFIHLFISVWVHRYLFYTLDYNTLYHYLFCCSSCSSFGHQELFQLAPVSFWHSPIGFYLEHFLIFWPKDTLGSSCTFLTPL